MKDTHRRGPVRAGTAVGLLAVAAVAGCQSTAPSTLLHAEPPRTSSRAAQAQSAQADASGQVSAGRADPEIVQVAATSPAAVLGGPATELPTPAARPATTPAAAPTAGDPPENVPPAHLALTL